MFAQYMPLRGGRAVHSAKNVGSGRGVELATYVVEKGKLLIVLAKQLPVPCCRKFFASLWDNCTGSRVQFAQARVAADAYQCESIGDTIIQ